MALTDGFNCYCGDSTPTADERVNDSNCNEPCHGDKQQTCGGMGYWQVYSFNTYADKSHSEVAPPSTCSTRVVTVYVTATPESAASPTPKYPNTTSTSYPTGWAPWNSPGSSANITYRPPFTSTKVAPTTTNGLTSGTSPSTITGTSVSAVTSTRAFTPVGTSYHGSGSRLRPHGIFIVLARLLTLSAFAHAQDLQGRFYPYPTPVNGPLPHATSEPRAVPLVNGVIDLPVGPLLTMSTNTMYTTIVPPLVASISGPPSQPISAHPQETAAPPGSYSSWWSTSTEPATPSPCSTGDPGSYTPWWNSVRNVTVISTSIVPASGTNNLGIPATTLAWTSTVTNLVNVTSIVTSTISTTETKTLTEVVTKAMKTPPFSGPAMSSVDFSGTNALTVLHCCCLSAIVNMLAGFAILLYILYM